MVLITLGESNLRVSRAYLGNDANRRVHIFGVALMPFVGKGKDTSWPPGVNKAMAASGESPRYLLGYR